MQCDAQTELGRIRAEAEVFVCPYCRAVLRGVPPDGDPELGARTHCDPTPMLLGLSSFEHYMSKQQ